MTQEEFYKNIEGWISEDKSRWNHITLMAYFCYKYEKKHGVKFRLVRWKGDPGKGKESRDFSKLFKILSPENYGDLSSEEKSFVRLDITNKIINYINWMFDYKFRSGDRSVNGTGIFLLPAMINEFERMYSSYVNKKSSLKSVDELLLWCKNNCSEIFELHQVEDLSDLKVLMSYAKMHNLESSSIEMIVLKKAMEMGII